MNPDPARNACNLPEEVIPVLRHVHHLSHTMRGYIANDCRLDCYLCVQAYDKDNEKVIEQPLPKVVPVPIVYPMPASAPALPSRGR